MIKFFLKKGVCRLLKTEHKWFALEKKLRNQEKRKSEKWDLSVVVNIVL